jgi:hypothetical protein
MAARRAAILRDARFAGSSRDEVGESCRFVSQDETIESCGAGS